jgi:hypothetical protein
MITRCLMIAVCQHARKALKEWWLMKWQLVIDVVMN